eukprot:GHVT01073845.1.p1 GENE.GHVT01073845.1~~GHVT01073845.1.p1  ORF type:complete len:233 (+),score=22.26 GHVT01073845.1:289-987(+)
MESSNATRVKGAQGGIADLKDEASKVSPSTSTSYSSSSAVPCSSKKSVCLSKGPDTGCPRSLGVMLSTMALVWMIHIAIGLAVFYLQPWHYIWYEGGWQGNFLIAMRLNVLALLPFAATSIAIIVRRLSGDQPSPVKNVPASLSLQILNRALSNHQEQLGIYLPAILILSTYLSPTSMRFIPAILATFLSSRVGFTVAYLLGKGNWWRGPFFSFTFAQNLAIIVADIVLLFK